MGSGEAPVTPFLGRGLEELHMSTLTGAASLRQLLLFTQRASLTAASRPPPLPTLLPRQAYGGLPTGLC